MMIQIARLAFTLLAVLVLLAVPGNGPAQTKPLRPYTLILDFVPTGEYVPHYTALEKGWYRDAGLDVKIVRGRGSADTVKRIAAGQGEVGISDISALIAARANTDVKVKAIALWYRRPPHGVFVRADSPIKTPKELEAKKLAISPGNSHQILWPVFERLSGLKPNSVTWVTMDAASMPPSLIKGATDAVPFFVVHEARIRKIAKQQNADIRVLSAWADLGFDLSSTSLVAREETIAKDPEGLKAFLRAALRLRRRGGDRQARRRPVRAGAAREDARHLHAVPRAEAQGAARRAVHQRPAAREEVAVTGDPPRPRREDVPHAAGRSRACARGREPRRRRKRVRQRRGHERVRQEHAAQA